MSIAYPGQPNFGLASATLLLAMPLLVAALVAVLAPVEVSAAEIPRSASASSTKWRVDPALREGMRAIRKTTLDSYTLVTHRRMPSDSARRFAADLKAHVERVRAEVKPSGVAAEALESLLADIAEGADAVAGQSRSLTPIDGIIGIDAALARYPQLFDDPEWKPLR